MVPEGTDVPTMGKEISLCTSGMCKFFNKFSFCWDFDLFLFIFLWNLLHDSKEGEQRGWKINQTEINVTFIGTKINLLSLDTRKLEYRTKQLHLSALVLSLFNPHLI